MGLYLGPRDPLAGQPVKFKDWPQGTGPALDWVWGWDWDWGPVREPGAEPLDRACCVNPPRAALGWAAPDAQGQLAKVGRWAPDLAPLVVPLVVLPADWPVGWSVGWPTLPDLEPPAGLPAATG